MVRAQCWRTATEHMPLANEKGANGTVFGASSGSELEEFVNVQIKFFKENNCNATEMRASVQEALEKLESGRARLAQQRSSAPAGDADATPEKVSSE